MPKRRAGEGGGGRTVSGLGSLGGVEGFGGRLIFVGVGGRETARLGKFCVFGGGETGGGETEWFVGVLSPFGGGGETGRFGPGETGRFGPGETGRFGPGETGRLIGVLLPDGAVF